MTTSAVCTPSWVVVTNETSLAEVPRLPATSGFAPTVRPGRLPAGLRSKSSARRAGAVTRGRHSPDPRTTTEDRPLGAVGAPGPGPRDVVLFLSCCYSVAARRTARRAGVALNLPAQAELFDQRAVAGDVLPGQVLQQPPAPADEQQQPAAAVVIMLVHLEVLG